MIRKLTSKALSRLTLIAVIAAFAACGSDGEKYVPGSVEITLNIPTAKTITFDPIAGATSYNMYIKTVTGCADVKTATFQTPTTSDTKVEEVTSPIALDSYHGTDTCFYAAVAAVNNVGEGALSNAVAWSITP